jgi:hypothetical protein
VRVAVCNCGYRETAPGEKLDKAIYCPKCGSAMAVAYQARPGEKYRLSRKEATKLRKSVDTLKVKQDLRARKPNEASVKKIRSKAIHTFIHTIHTYIHTFIRSLFNSLRSGYWGSGLTFYLRSLTFYLTCLTSYVSIALKVKLLAHWIRRGLNRFNFLRFHGALKVKLGGRLFWAN